MSALKRKPKISPIFIKDERGKLLEVFLTMKEYKEVQRRLKSWEMIKAKFRTKTKRK